MRPRFGSGRGVVDRTAAPLRLGTGGALLAISASELEESSAQVLEAAPPEVQPDGGGVRAEAAGRRSTFLFGSGMPGSPEVQPQDDPAPSPAVQLLRERAPMAGAAGEAVAHGIAVYLWPFTMTTLRERRGGVDRGRSMREGGRSEREGEAAELRSGRHSSGCSPLLPLLTDTLSPLPLPLASTLLSQSLLPPLLQLPARVVAAKAARLVPACSAAVVVVVVDCVE